MTQMNHIISCVDLRGNTAFDHSSKMKTMLSICLNKNIKKQIGKRVKLSKDWIEGEVLGLDLPDTCKEMKSAS